MNLNPLDPLYPPPYVLSVPPTEFSDSDMENFRGETP